MAAYFTTSDSQRGITPTRYVRDATEALYAESTIPGNMLYLNYSASGPENLVGNSQCEQSAIDIPPNHILFRGSLMGESLGDHQYNSWRDGRNEQSFMQALGGSDELVRSSITEDHQMGLGAHLSGFSGQNLSLQQSNLAAIQGQGLSLTLSTQIPVPSFQYRPSTSNVSFMGSHQQAAGSLGSPRDDNSRVTQMNVQPSPQGMSGLASTIPNSKYLKAAQQLLDEVVNVRNALKGKLDKKESLPASGGNAGNKETDEASKSDGTHVNPQESTDNSTSELSPTERQELQNKLTKLLAMLDEVDRRYKQYYHQMQIVVSSFDVIAGCGAAKPYTALALQTISKHFRCLRDAINSQIRATRKSLGEEDSPTKGGGISRLRYIDQHIRQQKAFQQFGMMQQHAWRPQRGLPENSVSILRAWLFEHFLHPYPKDSDKIMLARQTGLTRSQVSNWFINARVRLWKPMVEEMYKEEIRDPEMDSNSSSDNATKGKDEVISEDMENMKSTGEMSQSSQFNAISKSNIRPDAQMDGATISFTNEVHSDSANYIGVKQSGQHTSAEDCNLFQETLARNNGNGRLMAYQMAELGRYGNAGVSLTLGLQNFEGSLPGTDGQHGFLTMRGDDMFNTAPSLGADAGDYGYLNLTDNRHRFGPSQLLHDFVA